ncbi:ATPase family AAA domain-containing protein 1-B-like protein, partial [Tanacetum coccineum]
ERATILKLILKDESAEDDIDLDSIAALCEGYNGSDLLELCKKAAYFPIRDLLDEEKNGKSSPGLLKQVVGWRIILLMQVVGLDLVDDESKPERKL